MDEIAKRSGNSPRTVRHHHEVRKLFDPSDLESVSDYIETFKKLNKMKGFSLSDVDEFGQPKNDDSKE